MITQPFTSPKPKLTFAAIFISLFNNICGIHLASMIAVISGFKSSQFLLGATKFSVSCKMVATVSILPAAERQCPVKALRELMYGKFFAERFKASLNFEFQ